MQGQTNPFPKPSETIFGATTYKKRTKKRERNRVETRKKKWEKNIDHKQDVNHGLQ